MGFLSVHKSVHNISARSTSSYDYVIENIPLQTSTAILIIGGLVTYLHIDSYVAME